MNNFSKSYKKAGLRVITSNLFYFLILVVVVAIAISIQGNNFVFAALFAIFSILFIEIVIISIKLILYNGQYNIKPIIQNHQIFVNSKIMNISEIKKISRFSIRYYGEQINLEDAVGDKIKFFSPEALLFENDLINLLKQNNKNIEAKSQTFPNPGIIYSIKN